MPEHEKYLERAYESLESVKSLRKIYPKTHRGVVSELGLKFVNEGYLEELYGRILAKGMQLRERVDYDVYYKASKEEAEETINEAEMFVERIKRAVNDVFSGR